MIRRAISLVLLTAFSLYAQTSRPGFRVSGRVVHAATGNAIAGARLILRPTGGADWARVVLAKADGTFAFDGLRAGKYGLEAEYPGFVPGGFDQREDGFMSAIVTGGTVDSEHLLFRLEPACTITGTITDEFNEPVREARVTLFHRSVENGVLTTHLSRQAGTDDRGSFRFSPLKAGTYFLVVSGRPWYATSTRGFVSRSDAQPNQAAADQMDRLNVAFPTVFYPGTTEESSASAIELHRGESFTADMSLRSVPVARLTVIQGKEGAELNARGVVLAQKVFDQEATPVQLQETFPGTEGWHFTGFAPGKYEVHIVANDGKPGSERVENMDLAGETTIDLATLSAATSAKLAGIARAEGAELKDAFILFRERETGQREGNRIDKDGKFKIDNLPAGKYEVSVGNSAGVYLVNMAASGAKVDGRVLTVPNGADVRLAIILAKGVGEITGTAMRADRGESGVLVLLVPDHPDTHNALFRRDQSDSDGTFRLQTVVPGHYTLLAIEDGWDLEWSKPEVLKPFLAKGTPVVVEPGGKYDLRPVVQTKNAPDVMQAK